MLVQVFRFLSLSFRSHTCGMDPVNSHIFLVKKLRHTIVSMICSNLKTFRKKNWILNPCNSAQSPWLTIALSQHFKTRKLSFHNPILKNLPSFDFISFERRKAEWETDEKNSSFCWFTPQISTSKAGPCWSQEAEWLCDMGGRPPATRWPPPRLGLAWG